MNRFVIVTSGPDGSIMVVESSRFTEAQQAAIVHMLGRVGQPVKAPAELPVCEVPGFEPLAIGQQTATPVTERLSMPAAGSAEQVMQANREAAKAQVRERAQQARGMGYTGDLCTQCGSDRMKRNGSCLCCESCGATTGCS